MEVFYLLGSVQSFFLATLFFSRQKLGDSQKILIVVFLAIGLVLLDHYLELSGVLSQYPHLLGLTYTLPLLLGPTILLYTLFNVRKKHLSIRSFLLLHIWPFALSNIFLLSSYYFLTASEKTAYYLQQTTDTSPAILIIELLLILSIPIYSIWSILIIKTHRVDIKNRFSFTEDITFKWWEVILLCFVLLSAISVGLNIISDGVPIIEYQLADNITMGGLTACVFFIGYYGIKQKAIYLEKESFLVKKPPQQITHIDPASVEAINDALTNDKLYLNSNLTLRDLADHLDTTENKLSFLINSGLNKNFYDLINEYRVERVKALLLDDSYDHLSILGIAIESGFNSKSSFQSVFRKWTGMTPSQFKKQALNKSKPT